MEAVCSTPQPCRFQNGVCLWVPGTLWKGCEQVWGWETALVSKRGDSQGANRLIILNTAIDFFLNKHK